MQLVLKPFARASDGRRGPFFLSGNVSCGGSSKGSEDGGEGIDSIEESTGVRSGVGDCSCSSTTVKGALCGSGDMSMSIASTTPGEEEGTGGVFTLASIHISFGPTSSSRGLTTVSSTKHVVREKSSPRCGQLRTAPESAYEFNMPSNSHTSDRCGSSARGLQPDSLLAKSLGRVSC